MSSGGNTINDIYRAVISDVINQVKEAFLDENIDVDILAQLKKEWEDKVNSSGCVNLEATAPPPPQPRSTNIVPPPIRPNPQMNRMPVQPQPIRGQQAQQQILQHMQHEQQPIRVQYTQQPVHAQNIGIPMQIQPQMQPIRIFQGQGGQQQYILSNGQQIPQGQVLLMQQNGQNIPVTIRNGVLQPQQIIQQPPQLSHMNQMDGNGGVDDEGSSSSNSNPRKKVKKIKGTGATEKEAVKVLGSIMRNLQMDGGGGGMSDSSSEDEPEDDDDPLRRIADRIGDGDVEDGDQIAEEDPLNSGDDQSDDEDMTQLFDADNIVMCQFEKVNRARTKWKFQLKDGIMNIDKKDYCFQKCSGEAEW